MPGFSHRPSAAPTSGKRSLENLIACARADFLRRSFTDLIKRRVGFPVRRNSDVNLGDLHAPDLSHFLDAAVVRGLRCGNAMTFP